MEKENVLLIFMEKYKCFLCVLTDEIENYENCNSFLPLTCVKHNNKNIQSQMCCEPLSMKIDADALIKDAMCETATLSPCSYIQIVKIRPLSDSLPKWLFQ